MVTETPSSGDLNAGNTVTIALGTSEAVTVSADADADAQRWRHRHLRCGGSRHSTALCSTTRLRPVRTRRLARGDLGQCARNGASIKDGAGNAADLVAEWADPDRACRSIPRRRCVDGGYRHTPASGDLGAGNSGDARRWRPERGGDGRGRHPDADAQRRRHRDLDAADSQHGAGVQLHGWRPARTPPTWR